MFIGESRINFQVGKPEMFFALSLWRLCQDHGLCGSYSSKDDPRHYFRLADNSCRIYGFARHRNFPDRSLQTLSSSSQISWMPTLSPLRPEPAHRLATFHSQIKVSDKWH